MKLLSALRVNGQRAEAWKDKILDYEIETAPPGGGIAADNAPWKDKILDYEIETTTIDAQGMSMSVTWKDKILDYEIETKSLSIWKIPFSKLEKIRFSITRLKHVQCAVDRQTPRHLKR